MLSSPLAASTIRIARVTAVHPEGQKMEVIFLDTGDYGRDVQLMTPYGGTDFGLTTGVPEPEQEGHDFNTEQWDPNKRHINAVVATCGSIHICLGFLYPQCTHMAFTKGQDKNRLIERHTSDFVRTISDAGNMDLAHPANAHIRIGEGEDPDALEGKDFDGVWKLKHNKDSATVGIYLINNSKGDITKVKLCPHGDIEIFATRNIRIRAFGDIQVEATGNASVTAGQTATIAANQVQVCSGKPPTVNQAWIVSPCQNIPAPSICS